MHTTRGIAAALAAGLCLALAAGTSYAAPGAPPTPVPATPVPEGTEPPPPPGTEPLHVEHPTPEILAARVRLSQLQDAASRAAEQYDAAKEALAGALHRAALAAAAARLADLRVAAARARLDALAAAAYRDGSSAIPAALIVSDDPAVILQKLTTLRVVGARQTDIYVELAEAKAVAAVAHHDADQAVRDAAAAARKVAEEERVARAGAEQVAAQLAGLEKREGMAERLASEAESSAKVRDRLPQILTDLAAGQQALIAAQAAAGDPGDGVRLGSGPRDGAAMPPQPGTADTIREALAQLGKVYVWGDAGPSTFDCSGLTQWVWAKVGRDLPHNAAAQFALLPRVPLNRLLPGDLLFFWDPDGKGGRYVGHVGIYLGRSQMVDAPHTGDFVRIDPVWATIAGAGRVP